MDVSLACDADGTLWDSAREVYETTKLTWSDIGLGTYPFTYEFFLDYIRPRVKRIEDIFVETSKRVYKDLGIQKDVACDDFQLANEIRAEKARSEFYNIRDGQKNLNTEDWILSNPLYDNVPEMLHELNSRGINTVILSSKDEDSIRLILDYHKLSGMVNPKIIDREYGHRPEQFRLFSRDFPGNSFAYDDLLVNLEDAEDAGLTPILAPQGYETAENIEKARKKGIPIAGPDDVFRFIYSKMSGD